MTGCGDNSCMFKDPRSPQSGMRTNGGCRCFDMLPRREQRIMRRLWQAVFAQPKEEPGDE